MPSLNRIILIGRLTDAPESRLTVEGIPMAKFRLAVARPEAGANNVDYIDVVAWRKAAEICSQYIKKGQMVLVEGRIQIRSFEDQMGVRKWATEVVASNVRLMESDKASSSAPTQANSEPEETFEDEGLAGDLPF